MIEIYSSSDWQEKKCILARGTEKIKHETELAVIPHFWEMRNSRQ